ncbi:TonB-dependent receptor [Paraglaciecola polaris]|uniref:TonB-dependent receptor, plug n=1 Tax=Paraglaciecola polaris LMG 21857 TaxID=1129793 RepID=K6ZS64_9ALTE|nr:TonB-dependent receptor [Paraglaciecola polaris]GAC33147.1 TonB-dependent receptor, plug [Paraglaciecola polaris LMG 21857]|tara:strand:- start:8927 stop:11338 length:2412 start_codon:yes stop_codon:yes gene_type:complete
MPKRTINFHRCPKLPAIGILLSVFHTAAYGQVEVIEVTAQKRSEPLKEVPIAVTAFTGKSMETLGVANASDLVNVTPGFSSATQQGSNRNYFLRGVGTSDVHITAASAVGQYFDGVTLTSGFHAKAALFDMERVEILKGPQNTLFGLNTTGGAVNYISNKPQIGYGTTGKASLKLGNYGHTEADLAVGFDLTDELAARVAIQSIDDDGAFKSVSNGQRYGDDDSQAARIAFLWEPSDALSVTLNMHGLSSVNNSTAIKAVGTRSADGSGGLCADAPTGIVDFEKDTNCLSRDGGGSGELASDPSTGDWNTTTQDIGYEELDTRGAYLNIDYELPWAVLTSVTSWDNLKFKNANDNDGGDTLGLSTFHQDDRDTIQQELRLVSTGEDDFRWIAGLYYLDDDATSYTALRGARGSFQNGLQVPNVQLDHTKENFSVYFQGEYDFTDTLTLTAGVRWSDEKIEGHYLPSSPNVAGDPTTTMYFTNEIAALVAAQNPGTPEYDENGYEIARQVTQILENKDVGYTVKLDYKATEDSLIYASMSKGFKGSALDTRPVYALVPVANVLSGLAETKLEPESLDAWEIGYKRDFWNNRIQMDAAAFFYSYTNLQQFVTARGVPTLDNALESEIKGIDANVKYAGDNGLFIQAGISLLDSEITDVGDSENFFVGAELGNAPSVSLMLLASQEYELENGSLLTLTSNISHTGEQVKGTPTNGNNMVIDQLSTDAYTLLNANISYNFGEDLQYKFSVYGKNLTNERFCSGLLINDGNAILRETTNAQTDIHMNVLCRVTNASTRTYGISFGVEF